MSLVNDMLNDLDERRRDRPASDMNVDWMTGQKNASKNRSFMPLLWIVSLILLVVLAILVWRNLSDASVGALDSLNRADSVINPTKNLMPLVSEEESGHGQKPSLVTPKTEKTIDVPRPDIAYRELDVAVSETQTSPVVAIIDDTSSSVVISGTTENMVSGRTSQTLVPEEKDLPVTRSNSDSKPVQSVKKAVALSPLQRDQRVAKSAEALVRKQRIKAAEEMLIEETASNSQAIKSAVVLASLWLSRQRFDEAETLLTRFRQENPMAIELVKMQARLHLMTNNAGTALELLMTFSPSMNVHPDYYELLGLSARQQNQYALSVQAYKGLLEYDSSRGDWWVGMAIALELNGDKLAARNAYQSGLKSRQLTQALRTHAQQRLSAL